MANTIKHQTDRQLGGPRSVLARQRRDHAEIDRLMERYRARRDDEDGERALKELVQLVFSHAFAEETVLWPVVRRLVPDGEELTARVEEEHQQINDLVTAVERLPLGDPERADRIERAFALIRQDIRDEEDLLLPRLQEAMDATRLRRLGAAWETVRRTAPTHPHPAVPRRPPGNAVLGVPLSLKDRARDALSARGPAAGPRTAATGLAVLLALTGAARAIRRGRRRAHPRGRR
ncbi:hemerythrin domain-containing protein [Streptomyces sp. JB150]|uniref:hemerythrin domain-containing protein n=1 Tax=Streptomyces sp. JB150 TaxID=2714844 RepID=UPI001409EB4E|nr:hemerythrin domain-containing protein [Streptomyces sp. JB150]QIJ61100.1 hemerythrin domain-containing protein [Streptomyces sp. JB150]